jgi:hypothetical protein
MKSLLNNPRRSASIIAGILFFTIWVFVDLLLLPSLLVDFGYELYEPVAFGSWFVIILVILGLCIWGSKGSSDY